MKGYITFLTAIFFSFMSILPVKAAELQEPFPYGPGFFSNDNLPGITIEDVVLDNGYIVAVYDEALTREGIDVVSVGLFKMEESSIDNPTVAVETQPAVAVFAPNTINRWGITLSDYDREILAKIVYLEAGNQGDIGQQAVVEVIFNRVYSPLFPGTVIDVLSQRRQFSTWPYVNKGRPDARIYANIDIVVSGQSNILPYNTLYFSTRPFKRKTIQAKIQDHYFCNQ